MKEYLIVLITLLVLFIAVYLIFFCNNRSNFEPTKNDLVTRSYAFEGMCKPIVPKLPKHVECNQIDISPNKQNILELYNDLTYKYENNEEIPNGGILLSLVSTHLACKEYKPMLPTLPMEDKCVNVNDCTVFDLKDIQNILNINANVASTSCYTINATYLRADIKGVLFGPILYPDNLTDNNIGLILDTRILSNYIGCMYLNDSGSVGRYNIKGGSRNYKYSENGGNNRNIETSSITDDEIVNDYNNLLKSKKGRELAQAGCGLQTNFQGSGLSGIFNDKLLPNNKVNYYQGAKNVLLEKYDYHNSPLINNRILDGNFTNNMFPLRRNKWSKFVEHLHKKNKLIEENGGLAKLWKNNIMKTNLGELPNLYFENEIDIFVPNKPLENGGKNCQPSEEFVNVWKKAVIGVFTNNICIKDINYNKLCDNCGKLQNHKCGKDVRCCCNDEFNEKLVKRLVLHFNQYSNNIINGYVLGDNLNISENFPKTNSNGLNELSIRQITDYKSYYQIPVLTQKRQSYNQYFYNLNFKNPMLNNNNNNDESRHIAIAVPKKYNGKYIIHFDINVYNKDNLKEKGVLNKEQRESLCKKIEEFSKQAKMDFGCFGWNYYHEYLETMLEKGYIIISFSSCEDDSNNYLPGTGAFCSLNWNESNSSDGVLFKKLFKEIYCNNFIDEDQIPIQFEYEQCGLLGYSVGAQMVSRCFNDFPILMTEQNSTGQQFKFPNILCGILIGGGSYYCYDDSVYKDTNIKQNCVDPDNRGCCPVNRTELNYDDEKTINEHKFLWKNHPRTLLLQSDDDINADPEAAKKYYFTDSTEKYRGKFITVDSKNEIINFNDFNNYDKLVFVHYVKGNIHGISNKSQLENMIYFTEHSFRNF